MPADSIPDFTSIRLVAAAAKGEPLAASELFARYVERLTALARSRMSAAVRTRTDPEDVVLSVYRSFFAGVGRNQFVPHRSGELWRLLAAIAIHKVRKTVRHHRAEKRSIERETGQVDAFDAWNETDLTSEEGVELTDFLERVYKSLGRDERRIIEMRLGGHSHAEIAAEVKCSERTVRRHLASFQARLRDELDEGPSDG